MTDDKKTEKRNYIYIDVLTILSAFAVVMLHANGVFWSHPTGRLWVTSNCIETMFYFAVPIFFMISGATLMDYREKYSTREFFVRRAIRVGIPFLAWKTGCVLALGDLPYRHILSKETAFIFVNEFYNSSIISVYWFFLPLFVIYLSIPFLASVREKRTSFLYVIAWSVLVMAAQLLVNFLKWRTGSTLDLDLNKITSVVSAYPLLYPMIGYYLATYEIPRKWRIAIYLLGIAGFLMHFAGTMLVTRPDGPINGMFKGYANLPAVLQAAGIFLFVRNIDFQRFPNAVLRLFAFLKPYTFFVFLSHFYFILYAQRFPKFFSSIYFRTFGSLTIFAVCILLGWAIGKCAVGPLAPLRPVFGLPLGKPSGQARKVSPGS